MKRLMTLAVIALSVVMFSGRAYADLIIDFQGGIGGSVTSSSGTYSGSNIPITSLEVTGTSHDGVYAVTNGVLNFAYGPHDNTITINGAIAGLDINSSESLLTGSFSSFTPGSYYVTGTGPDRKSSDLLTALSLPTNTQFQFMSFTLYLSSGKATSSDITNTGAVATPEPSALLLLGLGLVALSLWGRRLQSHKS